MLHKVGITGLQKDQKVLISAKRGLVWATPSVGHVLLELDPPHRDTDYFTTHVFQR